MPRENRKRGKKHKKTQEEPQQAAPEPEYHPEPEAGPSWIVSGPQTEQYNDEAPFGYVDSEVKAYFRTVDVQLREWQEEGYSPAVVDGDIDPNEGMKHYVFLSV